MEEKKGFAIIPKSNCPHLKESAAPFDKKIQVIGAPCDICQDTTENWYCLHCHKVFCSRYVNSHFLQHYQNNSKHCIGISFSDLSTWCFECDSYIKSDVLYPLLKLVSVSKFGEEEESNNETASAFFVYGSLRPDDLSKKPYAVEWLKNTTQKKGFIKNAKLYVDQYPVIELNCGNEENIVVGYVIKPEDPSKFGEFQEQADSIEGYPNFYDRKVVEVYIENEEKIKCFVYFREEFDKSQIIPSGDFLDYNKK